MFINIELNSSLFLRKSLKKRTLIGYNQVIDLSLESPVEMYRDSFVVPHVYAKNELDLYKPVGYLTAQDRLFQMDLLRRVTEVVGDKAIKFDLLM